MGTLLLCAAYITILYKSDLCLQLAPFSLICPKLRTHSH